MKVLIIGLGSIAQKHISALHKSGQQTQLFAFRSSRDSEVIDSVQNIYDWNEVKNLKFDFILISNPTDKHKQTIENCLSIRTPLFIEKPLFSSLENCESLLKDSEQVSSYIACNLRFLHCLIFAKNFITNKRVNEVNVYCGSYLPEWRPEKDFRSIYSANKNQGGGVHIDLIHEIDYLYWMFSSPENVRKTFRNVSSLDITAFDYANYVFEYKTFTANIVLNYYRRDPKRTLEIICEDGTLLINLLENNVLWNNEYIFESTQRIQNTYDDQMDFFIEKILTKKESNFNTINEAYNILKLCLEEN